MPTVYNPKTAGRYGRPGAPLDPERCAARVSSVGFHPPHQCTRAARTEADEAGHRWCKQHDPAAEVAAREKRERKKQEAQEKVKDLARRTLLRTIRGETTFAYGEPVDIEDVLVALTRRARGAQVFVALTPRMAEAIRGWIEAIRGWISGELRGGVLDVFDTDVDASNAEQALIDALGRRVD